MDNIEKQFIEDLRISKLFSKIFPNAYEANLTLDKVIILETLIKLLEFEISDNNNEWIKYYIYDLDFGKENNRLKVTDTNGYNIPMSTAAELYSFLIKNNGDHK